MKGRIAGIAAVVTMISFIVFAFSGCGSADSSGIKDPAGSENRSEQAESSGDFLNVTNEIVMLEKGLSVTAFKGDDGFEAFLEKGGASSDAEVLSFLMEHFLSGSTGVNFGINGAGCSTISVPNEQNDGYYFGRNFDWNKCDALILLSYPDTGYSSITTVNTGFIKQAAHIPLSDTVLKAAALYAPLDGMNEMGLCASVNMIQDQATINQTTQNPDITTTTVIRLLMNKTATVDEALSLLKNYDMHASFGYMVHFAIADASGRAVDVEYIDGEMSVIETPVLTNFYLTEGDKYGIGTAQSHTRYEILEAALSEKPSMSTADVRDTLSSVSKGNFGEFESTEWSVVFDQKEKTATYYHRENYENSYSFRLNGSAGE